MKKSKRLIVQKHHIIYACPEHKQKDVIGSIYKGEHNILRQIHQRINISKGFIKDLEVWVVLNRDDAIDLDFLAEVEEKG